MLKIILVRPGKTVYDEQGRIQGNLDIPLSEDGQKQATSLVERLYDLGITAIYHGPCQACSETAAIVAKPMRLKMKSLVDLQNLDQGLWQGMLLDDVKHNQPRVFKQWQEHPENVCPPQGEMIAAALERVDECLERLVKKHKQGVIAVVAAEPIATMIKCRCTGTSVCQLWKETSESGTVETFEIEPKSWRAAPVLESATANKQQV